MRVAGRWAGDADCRANADARPDCDRAAGERHANPHRDGCRNPRANRGAERHAKRHAIDYAHAERHPHRHGDIFCHAGAYPHANRNAYHERHPVRDAHAHRNRHARADADTCARCNLDPRADRNARPDAHAASANRDDGFHASAGFLPSGVHLYALALSYAGARAGRAALADAPSADSTGHADAGAGIGRARLGGRPADTDQQRARRVL